MPTRQMRRAAPLLAALATGALACARAGAPATAVGPVTRADSAAVAAGTGHLPAVPEVRGPLALRVVYPGPADVVEARDSNFIFGSAGAGDAAVTINGQPAQVAPNGAWLGWIALPPGAPGDSMMRLEVVARTPRDSARTVLTVRRAPRFAPPAGARVWIDPGSLQPQGRLWMPAGEYVPLRVRATPGASVRLRLADGTLVPLAPDAALDDVPWGIRAFDRDTGNLRRAVRADRYAGVLRARPVGIDPGPVLPGLAPFPPAVTLPPTVADTAGPVVEAIVGADTARVRWPLQLAVLDTLPLGVEFDDDTLGRGTTDSITIGRTFPGGTYTWFFPTGTRAAVTGRMNGDLRVRLAAGAQAWVPAGDARPLPPGRPAPRATVGSVTLSPRADRLLLRVPLSERIPHEVRETPQGLELRLYGAVSDVNWIRYGPTDTLVRGVAWTQPAGDEVAIRVDLTRPVWGWRTRWDRGDLLLELRRPPAVDAHHPLKGRFIVVDPGHPPAGATGPTGLREPEANLAVALRLRDLLAEAGARVVMTRERDTAIDLLPRTQMAERLDAELLVSIHNNALPDGVNPFTNNGTSVFYNHLASLPLARAVEGALVRRLGIRDLGVGRGDLALVRPTWMPAILTEGLFMMVPAQEAALRSPEGQELYARGVFEGIRAYLAGVARER
ncbi:MAG TPA: N-acetylmuramoyl-L-alanine amidase [Gemmatimonadales bacterium]|nr:N-acetylmuramoyl-L-alanine amidase [Gemmatimonadales bacterium]